MKTYKIRFNSILHSPPLHKYFSLVNETGSAYYHIHKLLYSESSSHLFGHGSPIFSSKKRFYRKNSFSFFFFSYSILFCGECFLSFFFCFSFLSPRTLFSFINLSFENFRLYIGNTDE